MDNVCDRSLISIPSKDEMAEEQEYLWSNKYVQIDINNQKWYRDRMTWSDEISISSKKSSARTSLAIRENRESWDKSTGPRFLCERWVNAGAWKCGKLPTRREGLEPVLPFSLTLVRYESDHYNIAKILTYSVLGRIRRVGKPRNLGQCFSSAVSTLKASLVCSSGLLSGAVKRWKNVDW